MGTSVLIGNRFVGRHPVRSAPVGAADQALLCDRGDQGAVFTEDARLREAPGAGGDR
jgi:hypothetical protein